MANHFDVAVIGMQQAGLVAAALLAKRGRRVLVVDHGENVRTYPRKGLRLPLVPRLTPALETSPQVQKVVEELALGPILRTQTEPLSPIFQAVMPTHRVDVRTGVDSLATELEHEFPELSGAVRAFFEKLFALDDELTDVLQQSPALPPSGLAEKLKARSFLAKVQHLAAPFEDHALLAGIPEEHPVRELLLAPLTFFGCLDTNEPTTFHAVRLIAQIYRGAVTFPDRIGEKATVLLKAAQGAGAEIHWGAVVNHVDVDGRRAMGFSVRDDRIPYTADFFVANSLTPFHELLGPSKAQAKMVLEAQAAKQTGSLLVLNLVVDREVIPRGMSHAVFLLNGRRRRRDGDPVDPPLFVRRYPALKRETEKKDRTEDPEREVLSVACPVRTDDVVRSPQRVKMLKNAMFERVRRVVPFLDDFLEDASLPVETGSWDVEATSNGAGGRIDPWTCHPMYEITEAPVLGIAGRSTRTWLKNVLHAGQDVMPGLGQEGDYVTGLVVADTLGRLAGKRWRTQ